ncbi:homeobox-leucine zipper protein HAT9-like isoform X2 [Bidens hawaiensis]|uniref:homeobox-leucine zipper protein HAT9-like isoform X2 n=1 Tax=Bidens hawaiensis TaxID=980011 RepID=UPI0040496810
MGNDSFYNKGIVLELGLSSSMVENNSTKKPCNTLNFDPSLTLALSGDRDHDHGSTKKKHDGLYRQDSVSVGSSLISVASVCVKREREVKSEESKRVVNTTSEVEEEEDDNIGNDRKKLRLTKAQSALLEEAFKHHSTLNPKQKQELARELKLRPRQVEVWFQNRRARTKLKQTEVDCEYLKKCCEALKEENTRLHKELQELKALKLSSPPMYMPLPAATLTRCPSCERTADTTSTTNTRPSFTMAQKPHFFNPFTNPSAAC